MEESNMSKNIKSLEKHGFKSVNFQGTSGTGYRNEKLRLEVWWHEFGNCYIEPMDNRNETIILCDIGEELIEDRLVEEINAIKHTREIAPDLVKEIESMKGVKSVEMQGHSTYLVTLKTK